MLKYWSNFYNVFYSGLHILLLAILLSIKYIINIIKDKKLQNTYNVVLSLLSVIGFIILFVVPKHITFFQTRGWRYVGSIVNDEIFFYIVLPIILILVVRSRSTDQCPTPTDDPPPPPPPSDSFFYFIANPSPIFKILNILFIFILTLYIKSFSNYNIILRVYIGLVCLFTLNILTTIYKIDNVFLSYLIWISILAIASIISYLYKDIIFLKIFIILLFIYAIVRYYNLCEENKSDRKDLLCDTYFENYIMIYIIPTFGIFILLNIIFADYKSLDNYRYYNIIDISNTTSNGTSDLVKKTWGFIVGFIAIMAFLSPIILNIFGGSGPYLYTITYLLFISCLLLLNLSKNTIIALSTVLASIILISQYYMIEEDEEGHRKFKLNWVLIVIWLLTISIINFKNKLLK
tara:strand:- start:513 stop:1727 length:1215 start_codon:yes stop_codon:yes gene_type:complete